MLHRYALFFVSSHSGDAGGWRMIIELRSELVGKIGGTDAIETWLLKFGCKYKPCSYYSLFISIQPKCFGGRASGNRGLEIITISSSS